VNLFPVRRLSPDDPRVAELLSANQLEMASLCIEVPDLSPAFASQLRGERGAMLAAFRSATDSEIVGIIALRELSPGVGELKRFYVVPLARRTGVGIALVTAALDTARDLKMHTVRLDVAAPLVAAQHLYRRLGFHEVPCYNTNTEAACWFETALQ
jgi:ribosomal protein S18 acetylase RimI-like enzyme